jgi:multisubunit Na+/H+ antiporter MnhF subunit
MNTLHKVLTVLSWLIGLSGFFFLYQALKEYITSSGLHGLSGIILATVLIFVFLYIGFTHRWFNKSNGVGSKKEKIFVTLSILNSVLFLLMIWLGVTCKETGCFSVFVPLVLLGLITVPHLIMAYAVRN